MKHLLHNNPGPKRYAGVELNSTTIPSPWQLQIAMPEDLAFTQTFVVTHVPTFTFVETLWM